MADEHWITTETGSHILVNGAGEVIAGAGGKLAGRSFPSAKSTTKTTSEASTAEPAKATRSLDEKERNSIAKSMTAYTSHGRGKMSLGEWKQKARGGELDHLIGEVEGERTASEKAQKEAKDAKNKAWREKHLPGMAAAKQQREQAEKTAAIARTAEVSAGHEPVKEPLTIAGETDSAYRLSNGKWVPKSQVSGVKDGKITAMAPWLAKREGYARPVSPSARQPENYDAPRETRSRINGMPTTGYIGADDPSVYGSQLLGHEGESWASFHAKNFTGAKADSMSGITAAGVIYQTADGEILLGRRKDDASDHPGEWAFPGGGVEGGETAESAARREFAEETGGMVGSLMPAGEVDGFHAFRAIGEKFDTAGDGENAEFGWFRPSALPSPMHPGAMTALSDPAILTHGATELDIARLIAGGLLPSPQKLANVWLFALRITGTGVAYREKDQQFTWRDPAQYLNDEFLARCNGLPVVWDHPESGILSDGEFSNRIVGTVAVPFVRGTDVMGVAKIYNETAAAEMLADQLSTSPTVITKNDVVLTLGDGTDILVEGKARLLDHLAICQSGVWDKGDSPSGVVITNDGGSAMADGNETTFEQKVLGALDGIVKRIEALETPAAPKTDTDPNEGAAMKLAADAQAGLETAKGELEQVKADSAAANSALMARIAELEGKVPAALSADDQDAIAAAQIKADGVYASLGKTAPRPMSGEKPDAYRARLVAGVQDMSPKWKGVDLIKADAAVLAVAEEAVFADALAHAAKPDAVGAGKLVPVVRRNDAGHTYREYRGDNSAFLASIEAKPARVVGFRKGA